MKKVILFYLIPILICFLVGYISQLFQFESINNWYPLLTKPQLTPPNFIFPIAWTILYIFMGISIGNILNKKIDNKKYFITIFAIQLLLNFTWSILFFYFENPLLALINIVLLNIVLIFYTVEVYSTSKLSSLLFIPYIVWISFATYLNVYIYLHN